ncbi:hypothetical protein [Parapedobacter composti]|nr:hypothetical protein [Parapedobacter composti]
MTTTAVVTSAAALLLSLQAAENEEALPSNYQQNVPWQFNSDNPEEILDLGAWQQSTEAPEGCGQGTELPCTLMGPADPTAFQAHLNALGESGVYSQSIGLRDAQ